MTEHGRERADKQGQRTPAGGNLLGGKRILLRELSPAEVTEILADRPPGGQEWAPEYPLEGTKVAGGMLLRAATAGLLRPGFGMYQIVDRELGQVVGDIGFHGPPDEQGGAEIGFGIVPGFRGRGLVSEAARVLCEWALAQPEVTHLVAETEPDHEASRRVLTAAGFVLVAETADMVRYQRPRAPGD